MLNGLNMVRVICLFAISFLMFQNIFAQQYGSFKDSRDGKLYKTVKIGDQEWMAENLNIDRFRNGDLIPEAKTKEAWQEAGRAKQPAWCYFDNDSSNGIKHGKIYNYFAITDIRGFLPIGWHIPSENDYKKLIQSSKIEANNNVQITIEFNYPQLIKKIVNVNSDLLFLNVVSDTEKRRTNTDMDYLTLLFDELIKKTNSKSTAIKYFSRAFKILNPDDFWFPYGDDKLINIDVYKKIVADTLATSCNNILKQVIQALQNQNIPNKIIRFNAKSGLCSILIDSNYKQQWRSIMNDHSKQFLIVQECNLVFEDNIEMRPSIGLIQEVSGRRMNNGDYGNTPHWAGYKRENRATSDTRGNTSDHWVLALSSFYPNGGCLNDVFFDSISENDYGSGVYIRCLRD